MPTGDEATLPPLAGTGVTVKVAVVMAPACKQAHAITGAKAN
jgi:hypothetical protein